MSSFTPPAPLLPLTKARSVDINSLTGAVATAFAALPSDSDLNNGTVNFGIDSGTANTYVVTLPRTPTGYVDGLRVVFTPLNSNTGASTVNVNGLGVKAIRLQDNTATEAGTLVAGIPKTLIYGATLGNFFVEANSVTSAMTAAAAAAASASAAAGSASTASTAAGVAVSARDVAVQAAADAQAIQLIGTSASSVLIGLGTKNYTASTGKQWAPGTPIQATDAANVANFNNGTVTSYNPATGALVMETTLIGGSGTISSWNISVVGQRGAQGATGNISGGNLTGALNWAKAADVASAATTDIWSGSGNYETVTGTATITAFAAAPQAGANRRILAGGAFTLTAGANMVIKGVQSGTSYTVAAGDEIDVYAETPTKFQVSITKGDGTAMAGLYGSFQNTLRIPASGFFVARKTGWHRITLSGGSGRGGVARNSGLSIARATGAGAGGFCVGMRFLIAGQSYPVTVALAVAAVSTTTTPEAIQGVAGGANTFSGAGILSMTANGGGGGNAAVTDVALAGGVGGTATGGDINVTGGAGGAIATGGAGSATGGGAVGIQGTSYRGGNVTPGGVGASRASGGAGVGGNGGDVTGTVDAASGGGGSGGPAAAVTSGVASALGGVNFAMLQSTSVAALGDAYALLNATGGGAPAGTPTGTAGAGGGGVVDISSPAAAGAFAGGSGNVNTIGSTTSGAGGLFGGAPGGAAISAVANATSGATTAGLCQIEF